MTTHPDVNIAGPAMFAEGRAVKVSIMEDKRSHPRVDKLQYVFDLIKELVYREPFLDMIISIRDLKLKIEDPAEAVRRGLMTPDDRIDLSKA